MILDADLETVIIRSILWGNTPCLFDSRLFMLAAIYADRDGISLWWYMLRPVVWLTTAALPIVSYVMWILWIEGRL